MIITYVFLKNLRHFRNHFLLLLFGIFVIIFVVISIDFGTFMMLSLVLDFLVA